MNLSSKNYILFFLFVTFVFLLFFSDPKPALAGTIYCQTACGEQIVCGETERKKCDICCSICYDEEGNPYKCNCHPCCPCCTQYKCRGSWTEYRASTDGCEPTIQKRECRSVCSQRGEDCCSCGGCKPECDEWEPCEECGSWQKAKRACWVTKWGLTKPECLCNGACIEPPQNPQYYQSPDSSIPADSPVKLPVRLDWDDVPGWWGGGWSGGGSKIQEYAECQRGYIDFCWEEAKALNPGWRCQGEITDEYLVCLRRETKENCEDILQKDEVCKKTCPALEEGGDECYDPDEFVKSYVIEISGDLRNCADGSDMSSYTAVLGVSEFFAPCPCFFKSNRTYTWKVRACCGDNGETECGPWSATWTFKTNPAPEPKLPYDPDWAGSGKAENIPLNLTLKWCESDFKYEWYDGPYSYELLYYETREGEDFCHPLLKMGEQCIPYSLVPEPGSFPPPLPQFPNEKYGQFTKNIAYAWDVAACKDIGRTECTDYSQRWRFQVTGTLGPPILVYPPNEPSGEIPVEVPIVFRWAGSFGSSSFVYEVYEVYDESGTKITKIHDGTSPLPNFTLDIPPLQIKKKYFWRVKPCWDMKGEKCEEDAWSEKSYFWTTGRPPKPETMKPEGADIPIPFNFEWESVPGAKSYWFKIQGDGLNKEVSVEEPKISLDYPDLKQEKNYSWQVKTCAREKGELCGVWSSTKTFKTFKLSIPSNPSPEDDETIFTYQMPKNFSWSEVSYAKYYKYTINYTFKSPEEAGVCATGTVLEEIVSAPSDFVSLNCLGEYQWQVTACLDEDCQETGDPSKVWHFKLVQAEKPPRPDGGGWQLISGGLVPCGRNIDNPDTPWNEREPCQIKHIFILIRNIIDFLLWKLAPLLLVLLMVYSGAIFYLSLKMEAPTPLAKVKSLWRAAGIGYAILFFAWFIISFILSLFGYRVGIFGPWWQIRF